LNHAAARDALVNFAAHPVAWTAARGARRAGPLLNVPGVGLLVSGAEIARQVLLQDETFTKSGRGSLSAVITQALGPSALSNMDGSPHRVLRAKLVDLLPPARVEELLGEACGGPLERLRAELAAGRTVDIVRFMRVLTGRITCHMMGLTPGEDDAAHEEMVRCGERIAASLRLRLFSDRRLAAVRRDCDWLWGLARPSYERGDASSASVIGRLRGAGLSFEEARGVLLFMFLAGTLTTAAAAPRVVALLVDSGQQTLVRRDLKLAAAAVDEGLRFTAPVPATVRIAGREARLGRRVLRAGTRLVILTCNLARDAHLFPEPDRFDIARVHDVRARHLWYGAGPHFCLGFPLAQSELRLVVETLASLPAPLRIVRRRLAWRALLPAYRLLEVRIDRASQGPIE
jgi:cytochrome P450